MGTYFHVVESHPDIQTDHDQLLENNPTRGIQPDRNHVDVPDSKKNENHGYDVNVIRSTIVFDRVSGGDHSLIFRFDLQCIFF